MSSESPSSPRLRSLPRPYCLLCNTPGQILYTGLPDRSFAAPGQWGFLRCSNPDCGLVWLHPQPIPEDIGAAYEGYYTHAQPAPGPSMLRRIFEAVQRAYLARRFGYPTGSSLDRALAWLAWLHPGGPDELDSAAMYLPAPGRPARLLDVGCGSGMHLARMQQLGWSVEGVEVDPQAAAVARARGVPVRSGTLQQQHYPDRSFDAVFSAHVLEHVHDPVDLLRECARILKPDGTLVILTPNIDSLGHRQFGAAWLNLDPPRHLYLFSPRTLRRAAERAGLRVVSLRTTARTAWVYGALSRAIQRTGRGEMSELGRPTALLYGFLYQLRLRHHLRRHPESGDELLLFARPLPETAGVPAPQRAAVHGAPQS
ncbi:class I SAM-dependent methyltransferase [Limisphaera sp. VF-2]|uniref:class I SAM-dependent methyltransferase n=1 Tax=Limisphaera sp. VF-2 TaxID=3400418 RepID=UPI002565F996|nr:class I SAM-dependent methyltransferase [Limisphaera sp.]